MLQSSDKNSTPALHLDLDEDSSDSIIPCEDYLEISPTKIELAELPSTPSKKKLKYIQTKSANVYYQKYWKKVKECSRLKRTIRELKRKNDNLLKLQLLPHKI